MKTTTYLALFAVLAAFTSSRAVPTAPIGGPIQNCSPDQTCGCVLAGKPQPPCLR